MVYWSGGGMEWWRNGVMGQTPTRRYSIIRLSDSADVAARVKQAIRVKLLFYFVHERERRWRRAPDIHRSFESEWSNQQGGMTVLLGSVSD